VFTILLRDGLAPVPAKQMVFWSVHTGQWPVSAPQLNGVFMERETMVVMVVRKDGCAWWQLHFAKFIQRAGYSASFDDCQNGTLKDVADLWFPIPADETKLFSVVEFILQTHQIAHHVVDLSPLRVITNKGSTCTDYEIRYHALNNAV
jgi:hypothetical protein